MAHNVEYDPIDGAPLPALCIQHEAEPECPFGPVDETTYLLRSKANRERLLAAIENVNTGRKMVELPMDMLCVSAGNSAP